MLAGGEVVEYSAHVVSSGDMSVMPKEVFADGVLIAGEAANLVLNSGKAIQGMDFAMESGALAAETVLEARDAANFSASVLSKYRDKLDDSYVMEQIRNFQGAVKFLHSEEMFTTVPDILCDFGREYFTVGGKPSKKAVSALKGSVKKHSSFWKMFNLGRKAAKSL